MPRNADDLKRRVLVIGCGSIGQRHVANLRQLGALEILVYDPNHDRMEALVATYGVQACARLEEAYTRRPEAVLVCAPTSRHLPLAREALEHGCDVFVEKPLSHTLDGVDGLLAMARELGLVLMVGYNLRFNACVRQLKAWIDEGRIGHIVSARLHVGSYLPWRHPWEDYRHGYGARQEMGGGVILDAIHELDYVLWLFGQPQRVYCASGTLSKLQIDTEDVTELLLSYSDHRLVSIHLDYLQQPPHRWCELIGEEGMIHSDLAEGCTRLFDGASRTWQHWEAQDEPNREYLLELQHFIDCVVHRATPAVDGFVARQSLVLAMAAKRSAAEGRPLDLRPACRSSDLVLGKSTP